MFYSHAWVYGWVGNENGRAREHRLGVKASIGVGERSSLDIFLFLNAC
jgi:hypothetical protein